MSDPEPHCLRCFKDKSVKDFSIALDTMDGLSTICKECEDIKDDKIITMGDGSNVILSYNDPIEDVI